MADSGSEMPTPVNPNDLGRGPLLMGLTWTFTALSLIAVAIRFWIRISVAHLLNVEDWLMLLASILNLVCNALLVEAFHWGIGKHDRDLTFDQIINGIKWTWIQTTPGILSSIIARISIAILLVRIFGTKRWLKWFIIIVTVLAAASNIMVIVGMWTQATPAEGLWNPVIPAHRADPLLLKTFGNIGGSFFALGDLTYVLFPVMVVWRLNMPFREKLGLCVLLGMSLITCAIAVIKAIRAGSAQKDADDGVYDTSLDVMFGLLEQSLVIIIGCAPALRSVTKLEVLPNMSFASSLRRLVGRSGPGQSGDPGAADQYSTGPYYELGLSRRTQSQVQTGMKAASSDISDTRSLNAGQIRRTDRYMVSSEEGLATERPGKPVTNAV